MSDLKHLREVEDHARESLADAFERAGRVLRGLPSVAAEERDNEERKATSRVLACQDRYEHAKYRRVEAEQDAARGVHVVREEQAS